MSALPALITTLSLILYAVLTLNVGRARIRYGIPAPQTVGNSNFERVLRVQQNTLEQLVMFLPALWLFSFFISSLWGTGLGALWIIGRMLYAWGYYQAAEKRFIGFGITLFTTVLLLLGSLFGVVWVLLNTPIQAPIA